MDQPRGWAEDLRARLCRWLEINDAQLDRFQEPIPIHELSNEVDAPKDEIEVFLKRGGKPCYHLWPHTHAGSTSRTKPYCLRLNGEGTVGLDWEDSVIGAAEAVFHNLGYQTAREIGTADHIASLAARPDLSILKPGVNQRDLWALRRNGNCVDLYIIEAKGKEAWPFDYYCFAETLSQVFPVPAEPLSALLGEKRTSGHGLCLQLASRLQAAWRDSGLTPKITVAILLPEWTPDVIWKSGKAQHIPGCYYERPLKTFREFAATGRTPPKTGRYKYERAFGEILDGLEDNHRIRALSQASDALKFRLMTTRLSKETQRFELSGL